MASTTSPPVITAQPRAWADRAQKPTGPTPDGAEFSTLMYVHGASGQSPAPGIGVVQNS